MLSAKKITSSLLGVCEDLYINQPGDDTTVVTMQAIKPREAVLFSGLPKDSKNDTLIHAKQRKKLFVEGCG
ncbi:hypothetical protein [Cellulosilyticum ruminicola]|uniref:hypothetical protein n=1 Tax=Cellulosilyticum ruminicola TaxID=425254 RepID=UPI001A9A3403|nr:hypothetical protein [Cellulosilyticum ruminicola]